MDDALSFPDLVAVCCVLDDDDEDVGEDALLVLDVW